MFFQFDGPFDGGHTVATELPTSMGIKQSSSLMLAMYVCMYVCKCCFLIILVFTGHLHNDRVCMYLVEVGVRSSRVFGCSSNLVFRPIYPWLLPSLMQSKYFSGLGRRLEFIKRSRTEFIC